MNSGIRDKRSFELLFKEYYPQLVLYAKKIIKSTEVAEDIVQELFISLWNKREQITIRSKIKSYLYQSVHNACINHISKNRIVFVGIDEIRLSETSREEITETIERNKIINSAVNKLPAQRRKIFKLACYEGLKYREVAEVLNISVNTVKTQMGRALSDLRKNLGEVLIYIMLITKNFKEI